MNVTGVKLGLAGGNEENIEDPDSINLVTNYGLHQVAPFVDLEQLATSSRGSAFSL